MDIKISKISLHTSFQSYKVASEELVYSKYKKRLSANLGKVRMVGHFIPGVEGPNGPDDRLTTVGEHGAVQLVGRLQRALVRHNRVAVHQRCVQQADRVRVLLQREVLLVCS